jgi:hypothetical protein
MVDGVCPSAYHLYQCNSAQPTTCSISVPASRGAGFSASGSATGFQSYLHRSFFTLIFEMLTWRARSLFNLTAQFCLINTFEVLEMGWADRFLRGKVLRERVHHQHRAFRNVEPASAPDPWSRRILQLADGRTVTEIAEAIAREPQLWGPLAMELGVSRHLMQRSVYESLYAMADLGLVRLESAEPTRCS